jgi:hypothetical protein
MTTIHVQQVGDKAVVSQEELQRLIDIARRCDDVVVKQHEDDIPTIGIMQLAEQGGSFDFWMEPGEDIYSVEDGATV